MNKREAGLIPDSSFSAHESFLPVTQDQRNLASTQALYQELLSIASTADILKKDKDAFTRLFKDGESLSLDEAMQRSVMECALIVLDNPRLAIQLPHFTNLYRLLRTTELAYGHKRGGNTLLIGSGITIHEVIALYIQPPEPEAVIEKLSNENSQAEMLMNLLDPSLRYTLVEGIATAIEPDRSRGDGAVTIADQFGIPEDVLSLKSITIGEAISSGEIPDDLTTILWHRLEPNIFYPQATGKLKNRKQRRQDEMESKHTIRLILKALFSRLSHEGRFVITVGTGNDNEGYRRRVDVLNNIRNSLPRLGAQSFDEIPLLFEDASQKLIFGGLDNNTVGGLVFSKRRG